MAELIGSEVLSVRGEKIGKIDHLYIHGDSDEPNWASVKHGILGLHASLIPLQDAQEEEDDGLRIVYEKDHVKDAPSVEPDGDRLSDEDADLLCRYYGLERVAGITAPDAEDDIELPRETRDAEPPGLEEGPDSPLTKRRHERAKELGIPSATDGEADAEPEIEDAGSREGDRSGAPSA
jgi:hypothetical protein